MKQPLNFLLLFLLLLALICLSRSDSHGQCTGGTSAGAITPTGSWQTQCVQGGQYLTFSALAGLSYTFSFCSGGGSSSWDTEITILLNSSGSGIQVPGAYNAYYCATGAQYTFVAPSSNSYRVLVTQYDIYYGYGCITNTTCATLAFKVNPPDEPCTAVYINPSCNGSYASYSTLGATASSVTPAPACGSYAGADVWFKTIVPFGNSFRIRTVAGAITNSGMAVYKASSCSGPFTLIGCNDDIGGGNLMSQIDLVHNASLSAGDSIFIRFWAYNNTQVGGFGIYVYDFTQTYCMNGNPRELFSNGCIKMTPNLPFQSSTVWNKTQLDLSQPFQYYFTANFGSDDSGADGITFSMQNNASGMATIGSTGQALAMQGVSNSVVVEFDTYDNGAAVNDIANDHTAISLNGNLASPVLGPLNASSTSVNIEDGLDHRINISWDPASTTLKVYFDGVLRLSYVNDLVTNVFGGSSLVYWGFSSSTGFHTNNQTVCPGNLPGAPLPVVYENFFVATSDGKVFLDWATSSNENVKQFIIEKSNDGKVFHSIGNVKSYEKNINANDYSYIDEKIENGIIYYRLKEIDNDGKIFYSEVRAININQDESVHFNIYPNPLESVGGLEIDCYGLLQEGDSHYIIYDLYGRELIKGDIVVGKNLVNLSSSISSGIYLVKFDVGSKTFNDRLIVK